MRARAERKILPLPGQLWVTPSNPQYWRGSKRDASERFTGEQHRWMQRQGVAPADVETVVCFSPATMREFSWPVGDPAPLFQFECPLIRRRPSGQALVVSPSGSERWVEPDGTPSKVWGHQ